MSRPQAPADVQEETLLIALEEQRRVNDWIDDHYEQTRVKILTLLGGGLAALIFLYSDHNLSIPPQTYGRIFYFAALGAIVFALSALIISLRTRRWEFPIEDKDLLKIDRVSSKLEYLEYMKEKYMDCYAINLKSYEYKQQLFDISLQPLIFGVIILVVIKLFK